MSRRRVDIWLASYLAGTLARRRAARARRDGLTHVVFLVCDHFEPRHAAREPGQAERRIAAWQREFPRLQRRCRDAFGSEPLHSFFYPPHHGHEHLPALARMVHDGLGEVELHYHHDGDTAQTLTRDLQAALRAYHRHGLLLQSGAPPRTAFGFIHGDWALDNSLHGRYCGVNGELSVLAALGCWGDFTMPSDNEAQSRKINSIYYAVDDPARSKSYDAGRDARAGAPRPPGFFLMQGPLALNWRAPGHPRIENASLTSENWGRPDRIRKWLDCAIHVQGRPDVLFVKLHTHGAIERDFDALFGERAFAMHRVLNEQYNDGRRHRLHYVTARQAYNIVRALEDGAAGGPQDWKDYCIAAPPQRHCHVDVPHTLRRCQAEGVQVEDIDAAQPATALLREGPAASLQGSFAGFETDRSAGRLSVESAPGALLRVALRGAVAPARLEGGTAEAGPDSELRVRVGAGGRLALCWPQAAPGAAVPAECAGAPLR
jgi:hypothetical protein